MRKLVGAADEAAAGAAGATAPSTETPPARLLTPDLRAALRLLAPTLLSRAGAIQARLPFDVNIQ